MTRLKIFTLLLIFYINCFSQSENSYYIKNINIVKTNSFNLLKNQYVLIKNGIIINISAKNIAVNDKIISVVDGKNKYLIEGYTDLHAHLPSIDTSWNMDSYFRLNLMNGVTRIRCMRGNLKEISQRDSINNKLKIGPKLLVGFAFGKVKCVNDIISEYYDGKYDFIKYLGGLSETQFDSLNKIANDKNIQILGHIHKSGLINTLKYNYKSIEHFTAFTDSNILFSNKLDTLMKNKKLFLCPTFHYYLINWDQIGRNSLLDYTELKYVPNSVKSKWISSINSYYLKDVQKDTLNFKKDSTLNSIKINNFVKHRKKYLDNNIKLIVGGDHNMFIVPGFSLHRELKSFKDLGFSNSEIFNYLFTNSADYYNEDRDKIKINSNVDLIILNKNPLKDISNLKNINAIILNGKLYSLDDLNIH